MNTTKENTYLVTLRIFAGEYEKTARHIVEAETEADAITRAFTCEQHDDDGEYDANANAFIDCGGEFAYRAEKVALIPWDDAVTLRKYL